MIYIYSELLCTYLYVSRLRNKLGDKYYVVRDTLTF